MEAINYYFRTALVLLLEYIIYYSGITTPSPRNGMQTGTICKAL